MPELRVNGLWAFGLKLLIILIPMGIAAQVTFGWHCLKEITALRLKVARIEVTRFKATDGLELWEAVGTIRAEVASLGKRLDRYDDG